MVSVVDINAMAIESEDASEVMTKAEFAEYCHSISQENALNVTNTDVDDAEIDELLFLYSTGGDKGKYEAMLNEVGVYIYSDDVDQVMPRSSTIDVSLMGVVIAFEPHVEKWIVSFSGRWLDTGGIIEDVQEDGPWFPTVGATKDVGGSDAVGIVFYNTSGNVPQLRESYAQISDGEGGIMTVNNPATYNTGEGIAFEYQDYVTCTKLIGYNNGYEANYMGTTFSVMMKFGYDFEDFSGTARGFYAHTWRDTDINSIGISGGAGSIGVDISWSAEENGFLVYNNSDTPF